MCTFEQDDRGRETVHAFQDGTQVSIFQSDRNEHAKALSSADVSPLVVAMIHCHMLCLLFMLCVYVHLF